MTKNPDFVFEQQTQCQWVAGIDEAGCGPWAGPVVAASVVIEGFSLSDNLRNLIHDSKKLSHKKRCQAFDLLTQTPHIFFGVGLASVDEIDQINIAEATKLAMSRAFHSLSCHDVQHALVDGIRKPGLPKPVTLIKGGDQKSLSVAAASIIAKVTRDRIMDQLHEEFPVYGWDTNRGYGTAQHHQALMKFGITSHHRKSFAPIQLLVSEKRLAS